MFRVTVTEAPTEYVVPFPVELSFHPANIFPVLFKLPLSGRLMTVPVFTVCTAGGVPSAPLALYVTV